MRYSALVTPLAALIGACAHTQPPVQTTVVAPDSIVLERTSCFGICPAYRLSLTRGGRAIFQSRNPGDSTRAVDATAAPGTIDVLARRAAALGFYTLPAIIAQDTALCPQQRTDAPTAIVTIFRPTGFKQVAHYHGCESASQAVADLTRLEGAIDSAAGSARWVRPAHRR